MKFNLSEYIMEANDYCSYKWLDVLDVKEFIKQIKEEIIGKQGILEQDYNEICNEIDKLSGYTFCEEQE